MVISHQYFEIKAFLVTFNVCNRIALNPIDSANIIAALTSEYDEWCYLLLLS